MTITGGGDVINDVGIVGGMTLVTGNNSTWTNTTLAVGDIRDGTLEIRDEAEVFSSWRQPRRRRRSHWHDTVIDNATWTATFGVQWLAVAVTAS